MANQPTAREMVLEAKVALLTTSLKLSEGYAHELESIILGDRAAAEVSGEVLESGKRLSEEIMEAAFPPQQVEEVNHKPQETPRKTSTARGTRSTHAKGRAAAKKSSDGEVPKFDLRTKAGREAKAAWEAEEKRKEHVRKTRVENLAKAREARRARAAGGSKSGEGLQGGQGASMGASGNGDGRIFDV